MSRVCEICGKKPAAGRSIVRKGSPKYKGGIGLHTTGISKRRFLPNLHTVRVSDGKGGGSPEKNEEGWCLRSGLLCFIISATPRRPS